MVASTSSTTRTARARRRRDRSALSRTMLGPLGYGGTDLVERPQGAGALGLAERAIAEPRQLEEARQCLGRAARQLQTRERLAQELHRREPRPPRQPAVGGKPLEPRVAADDGAPWVGLNAQVLDTLLHCLDQRRGRRLARALHPPLGQAVAERHPHGEGKGADASKEGERAERPGD